MIEVHIVHFALGVLLFFIINWIGKHSYSVGYMEISMFLKVEEAPAFNFLYRIISPIVYLFIVSAIFYKIGLSKYVTDIYFVSIYYILFRLAFNLLTNRGLLMNWFRQFLYWISIITISYYSYTEIIYKKENILPDFTTIANELWIIILIFLFQTLNRLRFSSEKTSQRKESYLKNRLEHFKRKYGKLVDSKTKNDKLKSIAYAIMIYEDFNRPKVARLIENLRFLITKKRHSLGVLQVQTDKFINDRESVELGLNKLNKIYKEQLKERGLDKEENISILLPDAWTNEWSMESKIISNYNKDNSYLHEVKTLTDKIFNLNSSNEKTYLFPTYTGG